MSSPAARLIVWDVDTGESVDEIGLTLQASLADGQGTVVVYATGNSHDIEVPEAWVGKRLFIEVSPKAVTSDPMTMALADLAIRMGVPVG